MNKQAKSILTAEAQFRAMANIENQREGQVIVLYSHALCGMALLESTGTTWAKGGRDAAKGFLEAAGVSFDNVKRVLSRSFSLMNPNHPGYVFGLREAALQGPTKALTFLAAFKDAKSPNGITSQYNVIERTKAENNGENDPLARIAAQLAKRQVDGTLAKDVREIMRVLSGKNAEAAVTVMRTIVELAHKAAQQSVATRGARGANPAPAKSHVGKPLQGGGGSANAAKVRANVKASHNGQGNGAAA